MKGERMKATIVLFMLACCMVYGQGQPPQGQPARREGLRVGLEVRTAPGAESDSKVEGQIRTVFTNELRRLGDVRVTAVSENFDEALHVLVAGGTCPTVFVVHTDSVGKLASIATLTGKDRLRTEWVGFIQQFDRKVLEADRKRLFQ